uniref:Uncharacterized protein n=1 Tax=Avena sativa TaxID=4498 RepID=A0ACD5XH31_AVESA
MEAEMIAANSQTSTPSKLRSPAMDCRLLASACSGSFQSLESLLHGEIPSSVDDEESFLKDSLLGGVTVGGDTVLHAVATYGDSEDFLSKARLIHGKASSLLSAKNDNGDTPLHCATRAGNFQMLSLLVQLAHQGQDISATRAKALLETENKRKWTVLHEAVRVGENRVVKFLMEKDPTLAGVPRDGGTSPLYLAVLMGNEIIAETLHQESRGGVLSYSGPNGQNALLAAVLRGKALTTMLLEWNNALTGQQDENGSTPLHLAASVVEQRDRRTIRLLLLKANPNALYQPDHEGSFPIHVAASVDARDAISEYIENSPSCAGLRDVNGRTFLHVAAEKRQKWTVIFTACMYQSLSWILNMQDNDGNTVLHITVQAESLIMFWALFANRQVDLNLTNGKGQTPLDIAGFNRDKGSLNFNQNSEVKIHAALKRANAKSGIFRQDYFKGDYILQKRQGEKLEMEKLKDSTQNLCIVSALIATVTFGATFAMPGGYRADDHTNGGTPTLAGRYAFDAFTWANALAFTSATIATTALMCSGSPWHNTRRRRELKENQEIRPWLRSEKVKGKFPSQNYPRDSQWIAGSSCGQESHYDHHLQFRQTEHIPTWQKSSGKQQLLKRPLQPMPIQVLTAMENILSANLLRSQERLKQLPASLIAAFWTRPKPRYDLTASDGSTGTLPT